MKRLQPPLLGFDHEDDESRQRQRQAMLSELLAIPESQRSRKQLNQIRRLRTEVSVKARLRPMAWL